MNPAGAKASANANVALVKYFGKRDLDLNLPAAGSLSLTLSSLETTTEVKFVASADDDQVFLSGEPAPASFAQRVTRFLDLFRETTNIKDPVRITTSNNFPTAAGLASSASGFAALALASSSAFGLQLDNRELSIMARRGSGSAARSIPGGIVVWNAGEAPDGSDSYAHSIAGPDDWDLRVVVGITDFGPKSMGSTQAMELTRKTSPFYTGWIESTGQDLKEAVHAVKERDLEKLGEITERSALTMHATALSARPGIAFWNGTTVDALRLVRNIRSTGNQAYFTCDAGPQPKVVCTSESENVVAAALEELPGVQKVIRCRLGRGARLKS